MQSFAWCLTTPKQGVKTPSSSHCAKQDLIVLFFDIFQRNTTVNVLTRHCFPRKVKSSVVWWKPLLIRTQKVPLLLNLMDDLLAGMWDRPSSPYPHPRLGSRKCYSSRGECVGRAGEGWGCAHCTVIEVFTTRQKCDGTENVGDSDAWLNRLLCTDWRVALWVVMPPFIVPKLKGSLIREPRHCTACPCWYSGPRNKDRVSKPTRLPADTLGGLKKMHRDRT